MPLTQTQLNLGTSDVQRAGLALGRIVKNQNTFYYLARNARLVTQATQVLAFGHFDEMRKHLEGGVGWTVQMAKQKNVLLFVFDLDYEEWWWWDPRAKQFLQCEGMSVDWIAVPTLGDMTTLVGSRDTSPSVFPYLEKLFLKPHAPSGTFTFKCI